MMAAILNLAQRLSPINENMVMRISHEKGPSMQLGLGKIPRHFTTSFSYLNYIIRSIQPIRSHGCVRLGLCST